MKIVLFFSVFLVCVFARDYSGYKTFRISPAKEADLKILEKFEADFEESIEFWQFTRRLDKTVDILVPPVLVNTVEQFLSSKGLSYRVGIEDVQQLIDSQAKERQAKAAISSTDEYDYDDFHTYQEIRDWVYAFGYEHSDLIQVHDVAWSYEGRAIALMKIGKPRSDGSPKKAVFYQAGIHSREWLSPATVIYIIKYMVEDYGVDPKITALLDTFDYYIIPQFNADGYVYTWEWDRLWRKNRHPLPDKWCDGVDLNRNYPVGWGGAGARGFSCSYVYYGESGFSEMEHQYVSEFLYDLKFNQGVDIVHYIDFHTYSQLLLTPWSYSASVDDPADLDDQINVGEAACSKLTEIGGADYIVGPTSKVLYEAAGSSNDWAYHQTEGLDAKYSYVMELRDQGEYGFLIPASFINVSGRETYEAVKHLGEVIMNEFGS